jgi:RNA polymerase sigma factor (sigma-70 family)
MRQTRVLFEGGAVGSLTDGELLERYVARSDGAAFEVIVGRHGPMVLRACSAAVGDAHEADDAFQATFLVLVRKAGTIRVGDSLGPWLHEVARRVSACARTSSARRTRHERRAAERSSRTVGGAEVDDLAPALHEEVGRLPDHYRTAVILCDLEGLTQDQAAARLGWPLGTVRSRLARGRDRLRGRLVRRGLAPAAAPFVLPALSDAAVEAASRLASGAQVPLSVRSLTERGLRAMTMIRWKRAAALAMAFGLVGAAALARRSPDGPPEARAKAEDRVEAPQKAPTPAAVEDFSGEDQVIVCVAPSRTKVWAFSPATHTWRTYRTPEGVKVLDKDEHSRLALVGLQDSWKSVKPDGEVIAPLLSGGEIKEVAVFDIPAGAWVRQALREPAHGICSSYVGRRFAICRVGRYLYGFSAATGRWAVLDLGDDVDKDKYVGEAKGGALHNGIVIHGGIHHPGGIVVHGGNVYLHPPGDFLRLDSGANRQMGVVRAGRYVCGFSVPKGTWDVLDLGVGNDNPYPWREGGIPWGPPILVPRGDHLFLFNATKGRFQDIESDEAPATPDRPGP